MAKSCRRGLWSCEKFARICIFAQVLRISNQQSPIANLDYPFAFSNIADAKGCYRLPIADCGLLNAGLGICIDFHLRAIALTGRATFIPDPQRESYIGSELSPRTMRTPQLLDSRWGSGMK